MRDHFLASLALSAAVALAGCDSARKVVQETGARTNAYGCDRCHGYPPLPGWTTASRAHPSDTNCSYCHPQTVLSDNHTLIAASAGGRHENGKIDWVHGHEPGYGAPAQHAPDALPGLAGLSTAQDCYLCHGAKLSGELDIGFSCVSCHEVARSTSRIAAGVADFRTNCTFCHGVATASFDYATELTLAAPPDALYPHAAGDPAIGAHQAHLGATLTTSLACDSCHTIPPGTFPGSLDHIDGSAAPAFSGVANTGFTSSYEASTLTCTTYCHGATMKGGTATTPKWGDTVVAAGIRARLACDSCHGSPPPTGAGTAGWHEFHVNSKGLDCNKCHKGYVKDTTAVASLHVNGTVDVVVDDGTADGYRITAAAAADHAWPLSECVACHGHLGLEPPTSN